MKKYLLFFLFSTCFYTMGFSGPLTGKPVLKASELNQFFTIYASYQSSADDGGELIAYPQAYNYVTPNTTVWLFITYPTSTPSWSYQGGTASTGQWNSYLHAWEFYMPSGGWGIFEVSVGGQTAMYTIVANDYLNLSANGDPVAKYFAAKKETGKQEAIPLPANFIQRIDPIKNDAASLQSIFRKQEKIVF
jgi:hypothetical protein